MVRPLGAIVTFDDEWDAMGNPTGNGRPRPRTWKLWYAWHPVRVVDERFLDSVHDEISIIRTWKWQWLTTVSRRHTWGDRNLQWEYAPSHRALTQDP